MNILFDISILGSAHFFNRANTGIARAIENLLNNLVSIEECHVGFSAFNNIEQLIQSLDYLTSHPHLKKHSFCHPGSMLMNQLVRLAENIYPNSTKVASSRYRRRIVSFFLKRFSMMYRSLDRKTLDQLDIFHSTIYPLPNFVQSNQKLRRFITIYDMIPVLFPEYLEPQINKNFTNIIRSIRPDDWVIAISESTKNDFCDFLKFDPSRVFVTPLAASEMFYRCTDTGKNAAVRKRYHIPEGPYVLSLCTLEPRKNIDHTIRCFVRTIREQRIDDLNLVLVGTKGWDFDRIFAEITDAPEMKNRIIVTGYIPDEDLASLYSDAMMFVYPSIYEGFGLPPLEAMQCGVPVITSNTSSLPEVVGDAGIMVAPDDGDALCQAFWKLYRDSSLRERMSAKSLERARQFSWEKCAQDTVGAYRAAL